MSYLLNVILVILIIAGVTLHIRSLKISAGDNQAIADFFELEKEQLMQDRNLLVQEIKTVNQNIVSSDDKIKELSEELKEYKKINSYTKAELLTEIRGISVGYIPVQGETEYVYVPDTNCVPIDTLNKYYTQLPKGVEFKDEWISFNATVGKKLFTLDSMKVINKFDVTIGERVVGKKFLVFNKKEAVVDLKSYNPYTGIPYLNNIVVEKKETKPLTKLLAYAGIFGAGMITNQLTK